MNDKNYIHLGYCERLHGLKGHVGFRYLNQDFSEHSALRTGVELKILPRHEKSSLEAAGKTVVITDLSLGTKPFFKLSTLDDIEQIQGMFPFDVYMRREDFPELDQDEIYLADLLLLDVFDHETREKKGQVVALGSNGPQDLVTIRTLAGLEFDLPFVKAFFIEVDLPDKKVFVLWPEFIEA